MSTGVVASAVLCRRALREIPRVPGRIAFPMLIPILQMILFAAVFQNFEVEPMRGGSKRAPRPVLALAPARCEGG